MLDEITWLPEFGLTRNHREIHAVFVPELEIDIAEEASRLSNVLDQVGNVNIFLSEGAGVDSIVEKMRSNGETIPVDPFGHVKIDRINPGEWFANQFAPMIKAEKVLVQKSGYFARSAPANAADRKLIQDCAVAAVQAALAGISGLVGPDEDQGDVIRVCEFQRVAGGKPFDTEQTWFEQLLSQIGQPKGKPAKTH